MSSEAGYSIRQQGRSTIQTGPEFVAPKKAAGDDPMPVTMTYTNWRGQTAERMIIPIRVWWGSTPWHPEPQWLLTAVDAHKGLERDFALKDFGRPCETCDGTRSVSTTEVDRDGEHVEAACPTCQKGAAS